MINWVATRHELASLWLTRWTPWVLLAILMALISWQWFALMDQQLLESEQNQSMTGVTAAIMIPMFLPMTLLLFLLAALSGFRGFGPDQLSGQDILIRSAPVSAGSRVLAKVLAGWSLPLMLIVWLAILAMVLSFGHDLDQGRLLLALSGLMLISLVAVLFTQVISALIQQPLFAVLFSLMVLMALWSIDQAAVSRSVDDTWLSLISLTAHYRHFLTGQLLPSGVLFLLGLIFVLSVTLIMLVRRQVRVSQSRGYQIAVLAVLMLTLLLAAVDAMRDREAVIDVTSDRRHSLSEASTQALALMSEPVEITAFAGKGSRLRTPIRQFLDPWLRDSDQLSLQFLDPVEHLPLIRQLDIRADGELLVRYQDRQETLRLLNDHDLTQLLIRLSRQTPRIISYASGSGEGDFRGQANFDFGIIGAAMSQRGIVQTPIDLLLTPVLPDNLGVLIVPPARGGLMPGVAEAVASYLQQGGNLLLLQDPEPISVSSLGQNSAALIGYQPILEFLGISALPGRVIDMNPSASSGDSPLNVLIQRYPDMPITQAFRLPSLLPDSLAYMTPCTEVPLARTAFACQPMLQTQPASWTETGALSGAIQFNADAGEQRGPLNVGVALTRLREDGSEQRVVVVGDSDFLSNRFVANGGNLDLGLRMIEWLSDQGDQLTVAARIDDTNGFQWSSSRVGWMAVITMLLLPLLTGLCGLLMVRRWLRA